MKLVEYRVQLSLLQQAYENENEQVAAITFTAANKKFLHNLLVDVVNERSKLSFDPDKIAATVHASEYLRGQIDLIAFIMEAAEPTLEIVDNQNKDS